MKKMNKKGFTLIELLAVIVILAIIMVIAVPQILDVIENSRKSAWESNVKMIAESMELNTVVSNMPNMTNEKFSISSVCDSDAVSSTKDITSTIAGIADISTDDTVVKCASSSSVTVEGKGQFDEQNTATITYSSTSGFTITGLEDTTSTN